MSYKVWVCVEAIDEEADTYEDMDLPFGGVREFDLDDDAIAFATILHKVGIAIATWEANSRGEDL